MRFLLSLTVLLTLNYPVFSQRTGQARIDSIQGSPGFKGNDTLKAKMLIDIAQTMLYINPAKAYIPAREAFDLSVALNWRKGQANSLNAIGLIVGDSGNNTEARKYYLQALQINREDRNSYREITNLNNIARTYSRESNYPLALDYYLQGLKIAEELKNDEQISLLGTGLMTIFLNQQNYEKGTAYGLMAIEHGEKAHAMANVGTANLNLGYMNMILGDSAVARGRFARALEIFQDLGSRMQAANALENMAEIDMNDPGVALPELLTVRKIFDEFNPRAGNSVVNFANIGICYSAVADHSPSFSKKKLLQDSAMLYLNRAYALALEVKNQDVEQQVLQGLSLLEEKTGKPALALKHYKKYTELNDSLFSQDKKNQIAGLQGKHDLELKDKEISIGKLEVNNQRLLLSAQRKTQVGLLIGVVLLGVIGGLLFRQSRQRKKINTTLLSLNTQLDEANKVKARFFGILSHDLRSPISNLLNFLHLVREEPGLISSEEQAAHQRDIGRSAKELLETMESMLLWSKEQMDDFKPDIRLVPVSDLFGYLEKFFAGDQRVNIRFSNPENLSVSADENYLRVIMQNLTSNAVKALRNSPDGLIEWSAKSQGEKTVLAIKDNGPGIRPEQARALFSDAPGVNAQTGFGLHLVRDLARAIRYTISVDSTPGNGTTFQLVH